MIQLVFSSRESVVFFATLQQAESFESGPFALRVSKTRQISIACFSCINLQAVANGEPKYKNDGCLLGGDIRGIAVCFDRCNVRQIVKQIVKQILCQRFQGCT